MDLFTIGYSGRSWEEFVSLLLEHGIKSAVDIRSNPSSKVEFFDKRHLELQLSVKNIKYFYLGKELGGFRDGGFEAYTHTIDFKLGLVQLKEIAVQNPTAIICFEKKPSECHRKFVALSLEREGWRITHIID